MVRITSIIVAVIIFVVIIAISFMLLSGTVPAIDSIVQRFNDFIGK